MGKCPILAIDYQQPDIRATRHRLLRIRWAGSSVVIARRSVMNPPPERSPDCRLARELSRVLCSKQYIAVAVKPPQTTGTDDAGSARSGRLGYIACGYKLRSSRIPEAPSPQVHLLGRAARSSLTERVQRVHCSGGELWGEVVAKMVNRNLLPDHRHKTAGNLAVRRICRRESAMFVALARTDRWHFTRRKCSPCSPHGSLPLRRLRKMCVHLAASFYAQANM